MVYGLQIYNQFKIKPKLFTLKDTGYEDLVNGRMPTYNLTNMKWLEDVDHLYGLLQTGGDHWVVFYVDLGKEKIYCYDPINIGKITPKSEQKMLDAFRLLTQMIPVMLNDLVSSNLRKPNYKKFAFRRRRCKNNPQNTQVGVTLDG